ncbi:hypothetical protein AB0D00_31575 [Streptomyces sp. NPDC048213]|uniref:hypothetical protein n=1 Tax=Streptomyces sp. NPDC048213 TaxID=3160984 RepID=UPI0033C0002C
MENGAEQADLARDGHRQGSAPVGWQYGCCTPGLHGVDVYREWYRALNLPSAADGYGVLLFHDTSNDLKFTAATTDTPYACLLHHGLHELGSLEDIEFSPDKFMVRVG